MSKKEFYPITSLSKDDIRTAFRESKRVEERMKQIDALTDEDMRYIARKMADDYCNQLFWSSLEIIAGDIMDRKATGVEQ